MSPHSRGSGNPGHSRRLTLAAGTACLLVAGLIAPLSLSGAQAGPSIQPRTSRPTTTLAVIKVIGVGNTPLSLAVNSVDDTVYVANQVSDTVSVINGRTALQDATIDVGNAPTGVAVNQIDDTVYVTNQDDSTVSVINGRTATEDDTITVVRGPFGVTIDLDDDTVYVTNFAGSTVSVINGRNLDDSRTISVGTEPTGIAVNQVDDTIYVVNSFITASSLSVINGRNLDDSRTISVGAGPFGVAVDQDDDTVYVTNEGGGTVSIIKGRDLDDSGTIGVGTRPTGVAVNQIDDTVYVTNQDDSTVSVINGRAATEDDTIVVEGRPHGVAVDDTGTNQGLVYVTSADDSTVSIIGRVEPYLGTTSGTAGSLVTINVNVPQVDYEVDDATVESVSFGGTLITNPAALDDTDVWQVTAPAGTPGTTVAVPVTVTFRGGLTASAGSFTLTTPAPPSPVIPPSAPLVVTATPGDAQAQVTWMPPASSGSFPVSTYEVRSTPAGGTCLVSMLSCTITGLTNGTAYTFEARALNGAGWGPWSTPSNTVTPVAPPPPPSISITGSRGSGADRQIVFVRGTSTRLDGQQVRAHVKLRGQTDYRPGRLVDVSADGRFDWQRTTGKKAYIYFTGGGASSNRVIIPAAR